MNSITPLNSTFGQLAGLVGNGGSMVIASAGDKVFGIERLPSGLTPNDVSFLKGLTGLAFTPEGIPDFDTARANGNVKGAIPGGFDYASITMGHNSVTFFAAQVSSDRDSGALEGNISPQYVKGMLLNVAPGGDSAENKAFIEMALRYAQKLNPNDVPGSANYTPRSTFETEVARSSFERKT